MCWTASPETYWNMKGKKNNKSLRFKSRNLNKRLVKYTCWIVVANRYMSCRKEGIICGNYRSYLYVRQRYSSVAGDAEAKARQLMRLWKRRLQGDSPDAYLAHGHPYGCAGPSVRKGKDAGTFSGSPVPWQSSGH